MKRYLITSPKFSGEAELVYSEGILKKIDCSATNMDTRTIHHFKNSVPANIEGLKAAFSPLTVIVESAIEIHFNEFWNKYDHKFNKDRCEKIWNRFSKTDKVKAFYDLDKYHRYLRKNESQFKMHPDTYLRNRAWENDYR